MRKGNLRILVVFTLLVALMACVSSVLAQKKPPPDYFPMAQGFWWKYKMVEQGGEFTIKVTGTEKIGDTNCFKLDTSGKDDKLFFTEYYSKTPGKVMWLREVYAANNNIVNFDPARTLIHNPLVKADSWEWKGKGMMDVEIEEKATVEKFEEVTVPAGKFSCAVFKMTTIQGGAETKKTYWYAPNVGMVKSLMETTAGNRNAVLVKYNLKKK